MAFISFASNLVPGDTNGTYDVFVRDRESGATRRVSVSSNGIQAIDHSDDPAVSADGRYVAFWSPASNLVPSDTNGEADVFVHDLQTGTTERVSVRTDGTQGNLISLYPSISADGRFVLFVSWSSNLVPGDTNGIEDIFVRDRQNQTTECVSVASGPVQPQHFYWNAYGAISANGRFAAFQTFANNIVPGLQDQRMNVFVRDRRTGVVELVNVDSAGVHAIGGSYGPSISADGRFIAFGSYASSLVPGDSNGVPDVFVRDRSNGTTERVSVDSNATQANEESLWGSISADGRFVQFGSEASNLVPDDTNQSRDIFLRDRWNGTTERVSVASDGTQPNFTVDATGALSPDGRYVVFSSYASNLVPGDTNNWHDVFIRDRFGEPNFTSMCDPGVAGVIACPCSNPPDSPGRGCDNSLGTGGAVLSASGGSYLSSDSLVFKTRREKISALTVVTQWTGTNASGVVFGMGVRCTSGTVKRLYTKSAVAGSITAPDFGAGELQISARSAAIGDTILAGQSRFYLVYYRDPIVLGGCPSSLTFNATQTGQVTWSP